MIQTLTLTLTLTTQLGGSSIKFLNNNPPSPLTPTGKLNFRNQKPCKASLNVTEADPASKTRSSLYEVLRIKRDATSNEIKAAYRNLAKVYHPDSSDLDHQDDRKFIELYNAYVTLYNPADRAMYDLKLNNMGLERRLGSYTAVGKRRQLYTSRRWESDQCW